MREALVIRFSVIKIYIKLLLLHGDETTEQVLCGMPTSDKSDTFD